LLSDDTLQHLPDRFLRTLSAGTRRELRQRMGRPKQLTRIERIKRLLGRGTLQKLLDELSPEQRLARLAPEQILLALSDDQLQALPDSYLLTLPREAREAIRGRIGRPGEG
jgi:hypothetical protein